MYAASCTYELGKNPVRIRKNSPLSGVLARSKEIEERGGLLVRMAACWLEAGWGSAFSPQYPPAQAIHVEVNDRCCK
jgi:hypothetical protein